MSHLSESTYNRGYAEGYTNGLSDNSAFEYKAKILHDALQLIEMAADGDCSAWTDWTSSRSPRECDRLDRIIEIVRSVQDE